MAAKPEEYEWSSYRQFIGMTRPSEWLTIKFILGFFNGKNENYRSFVDDAFDQVGECPLGVCRP